MTSPAWTFLVAAAIAAVVDWFAILRHDLRLERFAKPAVIVALLAVAVTMEPEGSSLAAARPWLIVALSGSLVGDVLLLPGGRFRAGLAAFLVAQLVYVVVFLHRPLDAIGAVAGIAGVAVVYVAAGRRIAESAAATDRTLGMAVLAYLGAISLMAIAATATLAPLVVVGAWLFVVSDAVLGWTRFVGGIRGIAPDAPALRLAVMVPYHAAQVLLVLSLAV